MAKKGDMKTCPNCGASVKSMDLFCSECGHEFSNTESTESLSTFFKKYSNTHTTEAQCKLISGFPIPNNKEDILEFFTLASSMPTKSLWSVPSIFIILISLVIISTTLWILALGNFGSEGRTVVISLGIFVLFMSIIGSGMALDEKNAKWERSKNNLLAKAWQAKIEQAEMKVKLMNFSPREQKLVKDIISKRLYSKLTPIIVGLTLILLCVIPAFIWHKRSHNIKNEYNQWVESATTEIELYANSLNSQLDELPVPTKYNFEDCVDKFSKISWTRTWEVPDKYLSVTDEETLGIKQHKAFAKRKGSYALMIGAAWEQYLDSKGKDTSVIPKEYRYEMYQNY